MNEVPRQTKSGIGQPVAHYHRLHFLFSLFSHFPCRRPRPPTLSPQPARKRPFSSSFCVCARRGGRVEIAGCPLRLPSPFLSPWLPLSPRGDARAIPRRGRMSSLSLAATDRKGKEGCLLAWPAQNHSFLTSLAGNSLSPLGFKQRQKQNKENDAASPPLSHLPRHKPCARELKDPATLSQQLATIIVLRSEQRSVPKYEGLNVVAAAKPPSPFPRPTRDTNNVHRVDSVCAHGRLGTGHVQLLRAIVSSDHNRRRGLAAQDDREPSGGF